MPFIFYSHRFEPENPNNPLVSHQTDDKRGEGFRSPKNIRGPHGQDAEPRHSENDHSIPDDEMLEASEMEKIASGMSVRFRWPKVIAGNSENSTFLSLHNESGVRRRTRERVNEGPRAHLGEE